MTSMRQFERINAAFCELNPEHNLFGGVKVLIMGDFSQLEIISDANQKQYPVLQSPIFLRYVVPVPMLYGFRYKDDPVFYDFLCRMRENKVDFVSFAAQQWNFCTRNQLATDFTPEDRPVFMSRTNAVVNETAKLIQQHDIEHSGRAVHKVPHFIYEVSLAANGGEEVPRSLKLSSLFQRKVKTATMKRVYAKMSTIFSKALVEEASKAVWTRDGDCQINTTQYEFYIGQRLLITKNYCDMDRALMNGQEVSFISADEDMLTVADKDGNERSISMIWRGAIVEGKVSYCQRLSRADSFSVHGTQSTRQNLSARGDLPSQVLRHSNVPSLLCHALALCELTQSVFHLRRVDPRSHRDLVSYAYDLLFSSGTRKPLVLL